MREVPTFFVEADQTEQRDRGGTMRGTIVGGPLMLALASLSLGDLLIVSRSASADLAALQGRSGTPVAATTRTAPSLAGPGVPPRDHSHGALAVRPSQAFAYASDYGANTLTAFTLDGKQVAQLTSEDHIFTPEGITGDRAGNVYVANTGRNEIRVYSPGLRSLLKIIHDPAGYPIDVALSEEGTLAVTNIIDSNLGPGNVVFYAPGENTPCKILSDPSWSGFFFAAFDDKGTLFFDGYQPPGYAAVGAIHGGCSATSSVVRESLPITISQPGGIQVTRNDEVMVDDLGGQFSSPAIYVFASPRDDEFAKPMYTFVPNARYFPLTIAVPNDWTHVWFADNNHNVIGFLGHGSTASHGVMFQPAGAVEVVGVYVTPSGNP